MLDYSTSVRRTWLVGLAVAGLGLGLGAATPANAGAGAFIAAAAGDVIENPPVTSVGAMGTGPDQGSANQAAISACVGKGGHQCVVVIGAQGGCVAVATNDFGEFKGAADPSQLTAQDRARRQLENNQGARIAIAGCATDTAPQPNPPTAPKLGPTVAFDRVVGGLVAHVTDRSGVSSQCTYVTDRVNRSFALPAHGTADVRLVPAVPQFRNWDVTVTCDNGTKTQVSTFF
jgi:hypothetical protein